MNNTVMVENPLLFNTVSPEDLSKIQFLQPEGWTDIVPEFEAYIKRDYCYPLKVKVSEEIVGVGAAIAFENTGWLAHIIVDKDHRNKGIGYQIVIGLVRILKEIGINTFLLIATAPGKSVYLRAGFREVSEYIFFKRAIPWTDQALSVNIVPYNSLYYHDIIDLDRLASGENRARLLGEKVSKSYLFIDDERLTGYFIPGIGEGLIVARDENAGLELMKLKYKYVDKAVVPSENHVAVSFLRDNGFVATDTKGTRMILGDDVPWRPEMIFSRIGGNLG